MYYILYVMMLTGFLGVTFFNKDIKMLTIGILLAIVNALIFWK